MAIKANIKKQEISSKQPNLVSQGTKKEQFKSKVSRRKEIRKIRTDIN